MKKRNIIFLLIAYVCAKVLFYLLNHSFHNTQSTSEIILVEVPYLLILIVFSIVIWKGTTKKTLKLFKSKNMIDRWDRFCWIASSVMAMDYFMSYKTLPVYTQSPFIFAGIQIISLIAFIAFLRFVFVFVFMKKLQELKDK